MQVLHIIQVCSSITHFSRDKYLILKIVYPYSYLDLNNCWLTMIIGKTFELITCDSHSQEMNFMPYLVVVFYLMSSHREIRLNRTSLRHANIFFIDCMHLTMKSEEPQWDAFIHTIICIFMSILLTSISQCVCCVAMVTHCT
jgi:hypothetical protein